jgi:pimeloyl-ACP methyl ester carboxylesterase
MAIPYRHRISFSWRFVIVLAWVLVSALPSHVHAAPHAQDNPSPPRPIPVTDVAQNLANTYHLDPTLVQAMLDAGIPAELVSQDMAAIFTEDAKAELLDDESIGEYVVQPNDRAVNGLTASLTSCNSAAFPNIYLNIGVRNDGVIVPDLTKNNFICTENGVQQNDLFNVTPPDTGSSVRLADIVFLIDASGSMGAEISAVRDRVRAFASALALSDIDYRLGLVQFGNSTSYGPNPLVFNNGNLTSDVELFRGFISQLQATGSFEPGFLALRMAVQEFDFRPGAQKVFILISDEDSDDRNKQLTIELLQANGVTVHTAVSCSSGLSQTDYCDDTSVRGMTGGILFNVVGPYDQILDTIASQTASSYLVHYRSSNPRFDATERTISCAVTTEIGADNVSCSYIPGAAPRITLSDKTIGLQSTPLAEGTTPSIEIMVTDDVAPFVQSATLFYRTTGTSTYTSVAMKSEGNGLFSVSLPPVTRPGVDFYVRATDGQLSSQLPSSDPALQPFQIAVLPNVAPTISHTPIKTASPWVGANISARINDSTNKVAEVSVYWRYAGKLMFKKLQMENDAFDRYIASIPGSVSTPLEGDIQYYIRAVDDLGVASQSGTKDEPLYVRVVLSLAVPTQDIIFVQGIDSEGSCAGANTWLKDYVSSESGNPFSPALGVGKFLHFSYDSFSLDPSTASVYTCPLPETSLNVPAYSKYDTCDGVEQAAKELKDAIDRNADHPVSIVAHSMGGLVAAYMIATNEDWAQRHINSVVTFDSPLKGVPNWKVYVKENLFSVCKRNIGDDGVAILWPNYGQSLTDLQETSTVVKAVVNAAKIIPYFYPFDATSWVEGSLVAPRETTRLNGSRSFKISNSCDAGYPEPYCAPPHPITDNHGQAWDRRYDEHGIDKAPLTVCALSHALDCTVLSGRFGLQGNAQAATSTTDPQSIELLSDVPVGATRIRITSAFEGTMRMKLVAPDGTTYGPDALGSVAAYEVADSSEAYEILDPSAGQWKIILLGIDLPTGIESATVAVMVMDVLKGNANIKPIAQAGGPYDVLVGENVTLSANFSSDADGQIVLYEWDLDGDGDFESASSTPFIETAFTEVGTKEVAFRVTDDAGDVSSASVVVHVRLHNTYLPMIDR